MYRIIDNNWNYLSGVYYSYRQATRQLTMLRHTEPEARFYIAEVINIV